MPSTTALPLAGDGHRATVWTCAIDQLDQQFARVRRRCRRPAPDCQASRREARTRRCRARSGIAAVDSVIAAVADEIIVAGIAGHDVGDLAAAKEDVAAADRGDILDIAAAKSPVDAGADLVRALAAASITVSPNARTARLVDDVDVVARAADHAVAARTAIEHVVAGPALETIIALATHEGVVARDRAVIVNGDDRSGISRRPQDRHRRRRAAGRCQPPPTSVSLPAPPPRMLAASSPVM